MRNLKTTTIAAACALALAACTDNDPVFDNSGANNSAGATPSLGLVQNATVNFYQADGSTLLGSGDTGTAGAVDIDSGSYNGPVVVEVLGDDTDAMYFDEASGSLAPFPDGAVMRAMTAGPGQVAVTPLTELAYQAAVRNGLLPLNADEVNQLNAVVSNALAGGIDILTAPTLVDTPNSADLAANAAGRYALVLATLAYLGDDGSNDPITTTPPALAVLAALVEDLADGVIDNMNDGAPISAAYSDFANEFSAAIINAASAYAGSELNDEVANGDQDYETPATDLTALDDVEDSGGQAGGDGNGNGNGGSNGGANTTVDSSGLQDLGNGNAVTGTLNGTRRTISFIVNGSEGIGQTISIFAQGMPPGDNRQWQLNLIANEAGVQTCEGDGVSIQFTDSNSGNAFIANGDTGDEGGVCQLELTQIANPNGNTTIEGVFTGTLVAGDSNSDTASRTVTRGAFRAQVNFQ